MKLFGKGLFIVALSTAPAQSHVSQKETQALYAASLHTFSSVRSGIAIDDAATGIRHSASHLGDSAPDGRSLAGGWYNAADYGKWTMMAAISTSYMLHLYGAQQERSREDPALLESAMWGLAWLLKMQDADGGVRHKVDSGTSAALGQAWGLLPEQDPTVRIATGASTLDTADFAAVMYQASRLLAKSDLATSRRFRAAADKAYAWLLSHPHAIVQDPFYPDPDAAQEVRWARYERVASGEDVGELASVLHGLTATEVSWTDPSLLGLYSVAISSSLPHNLTSVAAQAIESAATTQAVAAQHRPFQVALAADEYTWASAEHLLHRASLFMMADHLQASPLFHTAGADQLAWLLGNNAMQHSLVVGFGTHPVQHPYHWSYMVYGKLMPGWAVLGPNGSPASADPALLHLQRQGTPPERCYVDMCSREGSWASNEGEISEQAALLFVTGYLSLEAH